MLRSRGVIFVVCLTISACVHTQMNMLTQTEFPSIDPAEVTIYLTPDDINGEYEKIALIHAQGEGTWTNEKMMIEAVRKKAASVGANGIILGQINEPSAGSKVAASIFGTTTTRRGQVVAVYVYDTSRYNTNNPGRIESPVALMHVNKEVSAEPAPQVTRLTYFRLVVTTAEKYSDAQVLALYRKKYPSLDTKSDDQIIASIEKKYKQKFQN